MSSGRIQFGAFELDSASGELRKHGIKIRLQEQPLQILQQLLEHPGEVVTREELQKRIWPADTFVDFDHGLYSAVQRLRDALSDTAETPRYVETLPRRGYRFIAPVNNGKGVEAKVETPSVEAPASHLPERSAPRRSLRIPMLVATGVLLVALLFALAFRGGSLRERLLGKSVIPAIRSLAVLPLQNLSNDPNQEYFADGMTDELITDLSQISALRVASHQSVLQYKKSVKSLPEIARELNVNGIVEGTVQRSGDRVRITAQLIYAPEDKNVFAKSYERDFRDVLVLQGTLAAAIADEIRVTMNEEEKANLKPTQSVNTKLLDVYWAARYHCEQAWDAAWRKQRGKKESDEEYSKAISSFDAAIQIDRTFIPAYLGMAQQVFDMPRVELARKAEAGLAKVLALDETNLKGHLLTGEFLARFEGQWDAAGREYRRAIELKPDSAEAHDAYAAYLDDLGRFEDGMEEHRKAQRLDPDNDYLGSSPLTSVAERLKLKRQFTPPTSYDYWRRGNTEYEAREYAEAFKDWQRAFRDFDWNTEADSFGQAYINMGPQAGAREMARILDGIGTNRWIANDVIIDSHFYAGDKENTLAWLEKAYKGREEVIRHLKSDHRWDPFRSDPRFQDLVRRVGLPE